MNRLLHTELVRNLADEIITQTVMMKQYAYEIKGKESFRDSDDPEMNKCFEPGELDWYEKKYANACRKIQQHMYDIKALLDQLPDAFGSDGEADKMRSGGIVTT